MVAEEVNVVTKLKVAVVASGEPQYELAQRAGLSETVVSRIVRGRRIASPEERKRLADALGVPERQLFENGSV